MNIRKILWIAALTVAAALAGCGDDGSGAGGTAGTGGAAGNGGSSSSTALVTGTLSIVINVDELAECPTNSMPPRGGKCPVQGVTISVDANGESYSATTDANGEFTGEFPLGPQFFRIEPTTESWGSVERLTVMEDGLSPDAAEMDVIPTSLITMVNDGLQMIGAPAIADTKGVIAFDFRQPSTTGATESLMPFGGEAATIDMPADPIFVIGDSGPTEQTALSEGGGNTLIFGNIDPAGGAVTPTESGTAINHDCMLTDSGGVVYPVFAKTITLIGVFCTTNTI